MGTVQSESLAVGAPPRRIDMDGQRCTVTPDRVDIRPSRIPILPLAAGLAVGLLLVANAVLWRDALPFPLVVLLVLVATVLVALSLGGLVFTTVGDGLVMDRGSQSAVWQQRVLGIGVGPREEVPFWKIERLELGEVLPYDKGRLLEGMSRCEVALVRTSGRRRHVGAVTVPRFLAADGLRRAGLVAGAIAGLAGKPVRAGQPRRRRRPRVVRRHYLPPRR